MPEGYKGKTKAEVRALVLANNQGKKASDKSRQRMNTELKLWQLENRDLSQSTAAPEKKVVAPVVEKKAFKNHGGVADGKLARDETYSDYAAEIRGEAPAAGLYKEAPVPKRGFIMKRNRK